MTNAQLRIAERLSLPAELVLQKNAILAMSGAGKSNTAVVLAEEMHAAGLPWVAVDGKGDWYGVRAMADGSPGLPVPVFGGLHGDVPLDPKAGATVAKLIAEKRLTCVLDVSEFDSKAEQMRFLTDFATALLRFNRDPLHVFCEEADDYLPQHVLGEAARCVSAWQKLVKRGRFRGVGCTLISQRSAALNKDALNQVDTLIAMRVTAPRDRAAIKEWVSDHANGAELLESLSTLEDGEAWVWSPQRLKLMERVRLRRRRTFDSGETPRLGQPRKVATLADIDLGALRKLMGELAGETPATNGARPEPTRGGRAAAEEVKALRARIAELEGQKEAFAAKCRAAFEQVEADVLDAIGEFGRVVTFLGTMAAHRTSSPAPAAAPESPRAPRKVEAPAPRAAAPRAKAPSSSPLGRGETVVLTAILQHPNGCTREQLTVLTGYKRSSRDTFLQKLKAGGLVTLEGDAFMGTTAGEAALPDFEPLPTGRALLEHWLRELPTGEATILQAVAKRSPKSVTREQLSDVTGYKRSSRDTYLQKLRARQLITTTPDGVKLSRELE